MRRRAPVNTGREVGGLVVLADVMSGGDADGAYVRQEARGQQELVASDTLPTKGIHFGPGTTDGILAAMGVNVLGEVPDDSLFQYVELPQGWRKVPASNPLYSRLLDGHDRERASIFYDPAIHDRDAFWKPTTRYSFGNDYGRGERDNVAVANVTDCDTVIFSTEAIPLPGDWREERKVKDQVEEVAKAWLVEHFPMWKDPTAYWD